MAGACFGNQTKIISGDGLEKDDSGNEDGVVIPFLSSRGGASSSFQPLPLSQPSLSMETYLVGFIIANVVGLQYYNSTINGRELVGLVWEPLNVYDENAIRVLKIRSIQVDHIERSAPKSWLP